MIKINYIRLSTKQALEILDSDIYDDAELFVKINDEFINIELDDSISYISFYRPVLVDKKYIESTHILGLWKYEIYEKIQ